MDPVDRLIEFFGEFPGIGPRQARRFAYFILTRPAGFIDEFTKNISAAKRLLRTCFSCQRFFTSSNLSKDSKICSICADPNRDTSSLMIVARDSDLEAVEKSGVYHGLYFVLGGIVPILEKDPEKRIRLAELSSRIALFSKSAPDDFADFSKEVKTAVSPSNEIILSMSVTPDGEHTAGIVKEFLEKNSVTSNFKITILGKGLSTGTELEYSDTETLRNAMKNRG